MGKHSDGRATGVLLVLALCLASGQGAAQKASFTIGVENLDYYPLHGNTRSGAYAGYARDVLDAFADRHGYAFTYQALPINRLFTVFLNESRLDFKYPDNPTWQAALRQHARISYSLPLVTSDEGAMVLPANKGRPVARLKTLGTVLGFTPAPYLAAIHDKRIAVTTAASFDPLLRHALAGHIDAVYINVDVGNYLLAETLREPGGLVFDPGLPHVRSDFSLSSRFHPDVIAQFNLFLQQQRPLLQQLRAKYRIADANPQ